MNKWFNIHRLSLLVITLCLTNCTSNFTEEELANRLSNNYLCEKVQKNQASQIELNEYQSRNIGLNPTKVPKASLGG